MEITRRLTTQIPSPILEEVSFTIAVRRLDFQYLALWPPTVSD